MFRCCYNCSEDIIGELPKLSLNSNDNDWPTTSPLWINDHKSILLSEKNYTKDSPDPTLGEIISNSAKFPISFPIDTIRCNNLKQTVSEEVLEKNINSVYPVIHEKILHLCSTFLLYQKQYGNVGFYKDMSLLNFMDRLLGKRAIAFLGTVDHYLLLDGTENYGGWEFVGTTKEKPPLTLENCLSYDEMKLSALLSISSYTCFINDGNRRNQGKPEQNLDKIEQIGVIVGLIGTRLSKKNVMEHREIVKNQEQNTTKNGYGRKCKHPNLQQKFLEFYEDINATYKELLPLLKTNPQRYTDLGVNGFFDKVMYNRRIVLSIDTLLIEANHRAKKQNSTAFIHLVGIGLGVWRICLEQNKLFNDTCAKRIEFLQGSLTNVSDICFAYIGEETVGPYKDGDKIGKVSVHINNRNPHEKLKGQDESKLLIVSYAWDCNALPGNEFWLGSLDTSSDPAAACSTQVAELHNYHINNKVRGEHLKVATLYHGLLSFKEYQELHRDD